MGKVTGFLEIDRRDAKYQPAADRIRHYREFTLPMDGRDVREQAARCMNCGIPFCHTPTGCPVHNQIPDWNDLVYQNDWQSALENLHSTNNFPEFTGRICPAPCEEACTLNLEGSPVAIKTIEQAIAEYGWKNGLIKPEPAEKLTGKRVAIIGGGPAGLAAAQQLARAGHEAHVYEKNAKGGGLLRYGIPDFKMEKHHIDLRVAQMEGEGVVFHYNTHVGVTVKLKDIVAQYDAVLLSGGSEQSRDLPIEGRDLAGIHFAMEFLPQQNRRVSGEPASAGDPILAGGKNVVVIGGGDTGSDCIGTSVRQGALKVTQFEIMPKPPLQENKATSWPRWPLKLRTSSSHEEGAERDFSVATEKFVGDGGTVKELHCIRLDEKMQKVPGSEFVIKADLVLLAMGFVHPVQEGMIEELGLKTDPRKNVAATDRDYKTSAEKVFVAGDMRRGQSLVVWAIREGRQAARAIDEFLMGVSILPR